MSMDRKAFVFDYECFTVELADLLKDSLVTNSVKGLANFIHKNFSLLTDPYEGEPLDTDWEENILEIRDVHEYGIALTKYYNPDRNIGLSHAWQDIETILASEIYIHPYQIILGEQFGYTDRYFDPGRMGSGFQSPEIVRENAEIIESIINTKPELSIALADLASMLQKAVDSGEGLYITF